MIDCRWMKGVFIVNYFQALQCCEMSVILNVRSALEEAQAQFSWMMGVFQIGQRGEMLKKCLTNTRRQAQCFGNQRELHRQVASAGHRSKTCEESFGLWSRATNLKRKRQSLADALTLVEYRETEDPKDKSSVKWIRKIRLRIRTLLFFQKLSPILSSDRCHQQKRRPS